MLPPTVRAVCFLTTTYPRWENDHRGTFIRGAALALQRQGIKVRVVTLHTSGARLRERRDGVDILRVPYAWPWSLEVCQLPEGGLPEFWRHAWLTRMLMLPLFAALCVGAIIGARGCQLIHAHWTLAAIACRITAPLHRKPYIATVLGSDMYQASSGKLARPLTRAALRESRSVIALSRSLAESVCGLGIPPEHVRVISNGVDARFFFPGGTREPMLIFCGSLIKRKGADVLIRAMPAILEIHPDYHLVILGDGAEREALQTLSEKLGAAGQVCFLGAQPQSVVGEWMRRGHICIMPSREEGQGVAALEAIACGTPCVASRVGGIPDYLTEEMGRLVPPEDVPALAAAIIELLDHPTVVGRMRRKCAAFAQAHLDWDVLAGDILATYNQTPR